MDTNTLRNIGMEPVFSLTRARTETFYYRKKHKRIIDHTVLHPQRMDRMPGPLLYAVVDRDGIARYVGKWVTSNAIRNRWVRHATIHHHESTRRYYISELEQDKGPLTVWSVTVDEIRGRLPTQVMAMDGKILAKNLEGLWYQRWRSQFHWNDKAIAPTPGFTDGEFWNR